ncbi:MAG: ECF transporter S component [Clostridia bacterium]|nr:ECF transporter S component [Clostridia bacterium]MBN2883131.1 ECF transporter S component [Clostridia bacterium]
MDKKTRKITFTAMFTALVFLATRFLAFPGPIPPGYINLGDSVIILCAVMMGGTSAAFAGAIGASLADITYPGGIIFAPFTFVVKGIEGFVAGKIAQKGSVKSVIIAAVAGGLILVAGYFLSEWLLLPYLDKTFGMTFAITELPLNFVQAGVNSTLAVILSATLRNKVKLV